METKIEKAARAARVLSRLVREARDEAQQQAPDLRRAIKQAYIDYAAKYEALVHKQAKAVERATHLRAMLAAPDPVERDNWARALQQTRDQLARIEAQLEVTDNFLTTLNSLL